MSVAMRLTAVSWVAALLVGCGYEDTPLPVEPEASAATSAPDCATPDESGTDPVAWRDAMHLNPTMGPKLLAKAPRAR